MTVNADFIGIGTVAEIGDPRYNTSSGGPPDPTPTIPGPWLDQFAVVAFSIDSYHKTDDPDTEGLVTAGMLGLSPEGDDLLSPYEPEGAQGIVLAVRPPPDWFQDPEALFAEMVDKAAQLTSQGEKHEVGIMLDWWRFVGDDAVSRVSNQSMPIAELEARISAALGTPTATP